ncbi:thioredoxin (plasmid) [Pseudomonas sp. Leaf58]|uniref:thioredoxin n=1 Tax=Pseudomonas sp. Leaf58 TaxID=1736226 RepID=UPI0006FAF70A|nr:thioredoxin [Pseudomonas sp. Leaf58]AYG47810.1 thioredoxin [Pseudomonas sp. Leaf58]KQN62623.1 thioredoxin [Pseudomonas sp. Leaf58]
MSRTIKVTQENFEEVVLKSKVPVLVDFWAPWCGPCKMIAPMLDEMSTERDDLVIAKIDISEDDKLAQNYGVRAIPTFLVFKNGVVEGTKIGAMSRAQMKVFLSGKI